MTDDKKDELLAEENNLVSIRRKKLSEIRATREAYLEVLHFNILMPI